VRILLASALPLPSLHAVGLEWCAWRRALAATMGGWAMIKRLTMWHVRAGVPTEIAVNHWLNDHVPLVVAVPGVRRYEQNPCVQGPTGEPAPYAGLGQVWFDTVEAALFALASWEWQAGCR
jgi:uncharacterized protein (TIGR02118 family)